MTGTQAAATVTIPALHTNQPEGNVLQDDSDLNIDADTTLRTSIIKCIKHQLFGSLKMEISTLPQHPSHDLIVRQFTNLNPSLTT